MNANGNDVEQQGGQTPAMAHVVEAVEAHIDSFLTDRPMAENLRHAIRYALFGNGKRMRPVLVVRSCEAVGGSLEHALPAAAAVEMIHAFSLVHDDLPAMDDDNMRRGRPTLHRHMNEAMAILAGDALTSLAFELVTSRVEDPALARSLTRELAQATTDMISGQVFDTLPAFDEAVPPLERLQMIHRHKTGALLRGACRMGGLCGGASEAQMSALTRYADAIGLMFQVVDDLLDVTRTADEVGKATQKDADKGKLTYPGVIGLDATRAEVARLHAQAKDAAAELGDRGHELAAVADYLAVRQR